MQENESEINSIIQNGKAVIMLKGELLAYDINSYKTESEKY